MTTISQNDNILSINALSAVFPDGNGGLEALKDISFTVKPQEFVCVLGPSGSGKSTLLRILAGLLAPTIGKVVFDGQEIDGPRRGVGVVFQKANLMPWRTVVENILLPLEVINVPQDEAIDAATQLIWLVHLHGFEDWLPRDLSGGMAQRVAIARALIHDPELLLLDEPFGALDALTRERMGFELMRIWQARKKTVIMVTHSISEALLLSDRVIVFTSRPGEIKLDIPINLPRPRGENIRYTDEFGALEKQIRDAIELTR